jgi:hypothetical protein
MVAKQNFILYLDAMPYDAITIDTSTVQQNGLRLESGLLATLQQFKTGPTTLLMTDIVINEIQSHLAKNAAEARVSALAALDNAVDNALCNDEGKVLKEAMVLALDDPDQVAKRRVANFLANSGVEVVSSELVNTKELAERFFAKQPPFEETGKKKNEFKDAIALMSLARWAEMQHRKILVVSADKGWAAFAHDSENLDVETSLPKALETVQTQTQSVRNSIEVFLAALEAEADAPALSSIKDIVKDVVVDWEIEVEANSSFYYEADDTHLSFESISPARDFGGHYMFKVVRLGNDMTTFQARVNVTANAHSSFSIDVWDSVDKEYVSMGSVSRNVDVTGGCDMLLTIFGDISGDIAELEVSDLELSQGITSVDFGEIEMDRDDYYYDEPDPEEALAASFDITVEELEDVLDHHEPHESSEGVLYGHNVYFKKDADPEIMAKIPGAAEQGWVRVGPNFER